MTADSRPTPSRAPAASRAMSGGSRERNASTERNERLAAAGPSEISITSHRVRFGPARAISVVRPVPQRFRSRLSRGRPPQDFIMTAWRSGMGIKTQY